MTRDTNDDDTKKTPVPPVAVGDVVAGKYVIEHVIGAGGMGIVVAAMHTALDQRVALKFIQPDALRGREASERFLREARAAVKLRSEHVARVFDVDKLPPSPGKPGGEPYIVMELLEGTDVARLRTASRERGEKIALADAVEYVIQACAALVEAHAAGIVHRDLKPQNLFVTRRLNGAPLVKVLDFGISKAVGPAAIGQMDLTDSTAVLGSPLYMAPEQMRSAKNADVRSDIWALGVILYELIGGQVPFDGDTVTELCIKVVNEPAPPIAALRTDVPADLATIVMRCLEKEPEKRFQSVAMLASALEPFSRSAERGVVDRPWRSFVDTMDQGDQGLRDEVSRVARTDPPGRVSDHASDGASAPNAVRTNVTWGDSSQDERTPPSGRKKSFAGGLALGVGLTAFAAAVAIVFFANRASRTVAADHPENSAPPVLPALPLSAPATQAPSPPQATNAPHDTSNAPSDTRVDPAPTHPPLVTPHPRLPKAPPSASAAALPPATPTAPDSSPSARTPTNGAPILK